MAFKRKITLNKKAKAVEKEETPVVEEEIVGTTVIENEITEDEPTPWTVYQSEEEVFVEKQNKVFGTIGTTNVVKPKWKIIFEAQIAPVPLFKLPEDIRQYLVNKWFSSDVWKKDKEWLEKHWADMKMIEKLKDFLTGM